MKDEHAASVRTFNSHADADQAMLGLENDVRQEPAKNSLDTGRRPRNLRTGSPPPPVVKGRGPWT